ncbi:MAG: chloramphenicol acetyltransferase [Eubacterium sp.]|nr:chloramphenicol acetyltransferase [Eubacterium sp.]
MKNTYKIIDEKNWDRAMHCAVFRNSIEPAFCVTFEVDVTNFQNKIKKQNLSFTLAMVYAVCKCANETEAFRYRFSDGRVILFDKIDTAFTYLNKETELFKVVNVPMADTLEEYVKQAAKAANEQKEYFTGPLGNDVFQCSPLPFLTYTHISHTNSGKKDNATPLFDWGKYYKKDNKLVMPVSVQAHHSFVDGIHIGRFAEKLQDYLNQYGN